MPAASAAAMVAAASASEMVRYRLPSGAVPNPSSESGNPLPGRRRVAIIASRRT
jgi:hypothetical protein